MQASNAIGKGNAEATGLLVAAEADSVALEKKMQAWALWQIGIAYQADDRRKALDLFQLALATLHTAGDEPASEQSARQSALSAQLTGRPALSTKLLLEREIARSLALADPKHAEELAQTVDPAVRVDVLSSVLEYQEKNAQSSGAFETLMGIAAQGEMPYPLAMRLMEGLKPEQYSQLVAIFSSALASYREHAPHTQLIDTFPGMLSRFSKRLPERLVREGIDEVLKQAAGATDQVNFSAVSDKGSASLRSLHEYRLAQLMPLLKEIDPSAARDYQEKYPSLANATADPVAAWTAPEAAQRAAFHPGSEPSTFAASLADQQAASNAMALSGSHPEQALSVAAGIGDANLRAQACERVARAEANKKESGATASAVAAMLQAAEELQPRSGFPFHGSAADLYLAIGRTGDAKASIEAGMKLADKLFASDADESDPNTALKAFWPSANAYCLMLRQAARVSHPWALGLLETIKDPEIKVAAEIALAAGWLNAPDAPSTIMTARKGSSSIWSGPKE